jgi:gliding motility-associated-like protein
MAVLEASKSMSVRPTVKLFWFFLLVFPTAFTPNHDGKNDLFKPFVKGSLAFYELKFFNRWGQMVFQTNDARTGWPGLYKSQQQPVDVFVWLVRYQFKGSPLKVEKGTVLPVK